MSFAGSFAGNGKTERTLSEINVVPLVDVMLVLLVIFMITAPMIQRGVDVAVPKTKSGNVIPQERLVLTITRENKIYAEGQSSNRVGLDELPTLISGWFDSRNIPDEDRKIYVRADGEVSYSTLMLVIDQAKSAGVKAVGLVTEPKGDEDSATHQQK